MLFKGPGLGNVPISWLEDACTHRQIIEVGYKSLNLQDLCGQRFEILQQATDIPRYRKICGAEPKAPYRKALVLYEYLLTEQVCPGIVQSEGIEHLTPGLKRRHSCGSDSY